MSRMKELQIEIQNAINNSKYESHMSIDEVHCILHEDYLRMVNESGMPLWMYEQYRDNIMQQYYANHDKEIDNRNIVIESMLHYENFKQSDVGENYYAYFGNWEDAYDKYLNDHGYHQQMDPDMVLS